MRHSSITLTVAAVIAVALTAVRAENAPSAANAAGSERLSLDPGWWFNLGDIPMPVISGHGDTYSNAKAGKAWGAAARACSPPISSVTSRRSA